MRLASVMGLQLTRAVSGDLAGVFLIVVLVAGALALLAALIDIARALDSRTLDRASRAEQSPQQDGKNEQAGAETAPTPTGAAPQDPSACG